MLKFWLGMTREDKMVAVGIIAWTVAAIVILWIKTWGL